MKERRKKEKGHSGRSHRKERRKKEKGHSGRSHRKERGREGRRERT